MYKILYKTDTLAKIVKFYKDNRCAIETRTSKKQNGKWITHLRCDINYFYDSVSKKLITEDYIKQKYLINNK